jgi:purine-binding chemotaxis protein CheW
MSSGLDRIDWDAIKARIAHLSSLADADGSWTESEAAALLAERAAELAKVDEVVDTEATLDLVSFLVGRETFALATTFVQEVVQVARCAAAPCAPSFLLGIFNYRGTLLPVVDLAPIFGLGKWDAVVSKVLVLGETSSEMAVATEAVNEVFAIAKSAILPVPDSVSVGARHFMLGTTRDAVTVLEGRTLLTDPAFRVGARAKTTSIS